MAAAQVTSAAPYLALLEEEDDKLKVHALQQLDGLVPQFWYQISNYIPQVEALSEDDEFDNREKASLLASKVFYYLRSLDDALTHALGAGSLFDITDQSEYVKTIVARAIDKYFELRQASEAQANGTASNDAATESAIDPRLEAIVDRMLARCIADQQYEQPQGVGNQGAHFSVVFIAASQCLKPGLERACAHYMAAACGHDTTTSFVQAIGMCLEGRRLDKLRETIVNCAQPLAALHYARHAASTVVSRAVREPVLRLIVSTFQELIAQLGPGDWVAVAQALSELDEADEVAALLVRLVDGCEGTGSDALLALQIAFDLFDNDVQGFLRRVEDKISEAKKRAIPEGADAAAEGEGTPLQRMYTTLLSVLSGAWPVRLNLEFLYFSNATDLQLLQNMKEAFDARVSMCHSALVMANAFMHAGTTRDTFLRDNLEWLKTATNWAMFGATASLGVIHHGHLGKAREVLAPYLPAEARQQTSPYSEGGALYALGLIHASHGQPVVDFISTSLSNARNQVVQHGACLGLGLAAQGTDDPVIYEKLKETLYNDEAASGEAAGIAMGLLSIGAAETSADGHATEMLAYAHDTNHEKIIRGLSVGLALLCYGREEGADAMVEKLTTDQDPILRFGGMFAVGLAYRGTDNNTAIQRLLRYAVTDVSDDVRRAAVLNLGFVLLGVPDQCPAIVSQLARSYNAHLRYGAAMAVGISCAGTGVSYAGLKSAKALLEPMLKDPVDFVRQGVCIAIALVMVQQPEEDVMSFRKHLETTYSNKHEDAVSKMGAIMASGILDASGRNATVGMVSASGVFRRTSIVSMALFTQYWYWFPMAYMLALSFAPTALIGVTADLKLPKFNVVCQCPKGRFAYAKPVADSSKKKVTKLPTAVLSTTKKAKERAKRKAEARAAGGDLSQSLQSLPSVASSAAGGGENGAAPMETDAVTGDGKEGGDSGKTAEAKEAEDEKAKERAEKEEAARCPFEIQNPARVTPAQRQFVAFTEGSRFQPIKPGGRTGVLVLVDTTPDQPVEYVENQSMATGGLVVAGAGNASGANGDAATDAAEQGGDAAPTQTAAVTSTLASSPAPPAEPDAPEDMDYED